MPTPQKPDEFAVLLTSRVLSQRGDNPILEDHTFSAPRDARLIGFWVVNMTPYANQDQLQDIRLLRPTLDDEPVDLRNGTSDSLFFGLFFEVRAPNRRPVMADTRRIKFDLYFRECHSPPAPELNIHIYAVFSTQNYIFQANRWEEAMTKFWDLGGHTSSYRALRDHHLLDSWKTSEPGNMVGAEPYRFKDLNVRTLGYLTSFRLRAKIPPVFGNVRARLRLSGVDVFEATLTKWVEGQFPDRELLLWPDIDASFRLVNAPDLSLDFDFELSGFEMNLGPYTRLMSHILLNVAGV